MTTEAKVGCFTIAALALLTLLVVRLGGYGLGGGGGYEIQAVFSQVDGLKNGNLVRFAGVDVGRVSRVRADGNSARVYLNINSGVQIPSDALFTMSSDGLMGEKFIAIYPGAGKAEPLKPGDEVGGKAQQDLNHLFVTADETLADIHKLVQSLNEVFGDARVKESLIGSAISAREITENLSRMSAVMSRMAVANEQDIRGIVQNLTAMSESMMLAADRVDGMLASVDDDGRTAAEIKEAVHNLSSTSRRVENMATVLEGVVTDPETAQNIKETLKNAKSVTQKADRMMRQVSEIKTEMNAEVLYGAGPGRYMANADVRLYTSPEAFYLVGVNDIGEGNKANLQIGRRKGAMTGRFGLFDSKAGVGVDAQMSPALKFSVDAYDPNDARLRLRAEYEFAPDTYLVGQTNDINKKDVRESFVGVRHRF